MISPNRLLIASCLLLALATPGLRASETYQEPFRPQFHFTPATNWMNDPNGLVYYEGEYHLFYQFNPFGNRWGHMSWGHAVSKDMLHWEHLPIALAEENGVMIFYGSAVVDWNNRSGFGQNGKPPLVAIYTGHYTTKPLQNQQIAYSNDRGRTWTKYSGNPVLDIGERDFRDPKVFWHELSKRWVMITAWPTHHQTRLYASPDLKHWTHLSDFGPAGSIKGIWECPDLFPVSVEGSRETKWVMIVNVGSGAPAGASGCQYFVGEFDGARFVLDESFPKRSANIDPTGKVLADFDGDHYGDWKATGTAFGAGPARGTLADQQAVSNFRGRGLVNSYNNGDNSQGTLTSPEFAIDKDYLAFLIGGGNHAGKTCLNLLLDGKAVRTATGDADERLDWKSWDVREFRGRKATLEVVDQDSGGWGHINVDQIMLTDKPARREPEPALWADYGRDFYAAVSWSDIPKSDGRRLWLGWMSNWEYAGDVPTSPWRSAMTTPRELELRRTPNGLRLVQKPARELVKLRTSEHRLTRSSVEKANDWLKQLRLGSLLEVELELSGTGNASEGLSFSTGPSEAIAITYDADAAQLRFDRTHSGKVDFHRAFPGVHSAPLNLSKGRLALRLFIDTSSVEVFANGGEKVLTELMFPTEAARQIKLSADTKTTRVDKLTIWELKSCWE